MTTTTTQFLLSRINQYYYNPSSIMQGMLDTLELGLNGNDIVDPTSPFVQLLEFAATASTASIIKSEAVTRAMYPALCLTQSDLFNHLSDTDYVGLFASPASTSITMMIPYQQLIAAAIAPDASNLNIKQVIIPANSQITVNGINLVVGYPVNITIQTVTNLGSTSTTILTTLDTTVTNPLVKLKTNIISNAVVAYNGSQYLQFNLPVQQLSNTSTVYSLNSATTFGQTINFSDSFCYARAYINLASSPGQWTEILTTHSVINYDINSPTLKMRVNNGSLSVALPDIYNSLNLTGNSIRIDIYTCKGLMDLDLSQLNAGSFSGKWMDFNTFNSKNTTAAIGKVSDIIIYSNDSLTNGINGLTLEQIRELVIYRSNSSSTPVRLSDLTLGLGKLGYVVQKIVDSVTDRIFVASKNIQSRVVDGLVTNPLIANIAVNLNEHWGDVGAAYTDSIINHNSNAATLLPNALFLMSNGNINLLTNADLDSINNLAMDSLAVALSNNLYFYTPFHYVIDYSLPTINVRPYYLSGPIVVNNNYIANNPYRTYGINTIISTISLTGNNYTLSLTTKIPTGLTNIYCQLVYTDPSSYKSYYLDSTSIINQASATFTFVLNTEFDINQQDDIEMINFYDDNRMVDFINVNLTQQFSVYYFVQANAIDLEITPYGTNFDSQYMPPTGITVIGATHETITLEFGNRLTSLYCPTKQLLATTNYVTYTQVVNATYAENIYKEGPLGKLYTVNTDGTISFELLHAKGDPVLDANGHNVILHNVGDPVMDANGNSIPIEPASNQILRQLGVTFVDAKYRFATTASTASYNLSIPTQIINYLNYDIEPYIDTLNERTELYFKPMGEANSIKVNFGNGTTGTVNSLLNINIIFYLNVTADSIKKQTAETQNLINNTTILVRSLISKYLSKTTISMSEFTAELNNNKSPLVSGFDIVSFLPNNASILTILDVGVSFSVAETLTLLSDGTLDVVDSVNLVFESLL